MYDEENTSMTQTLLTLEITITINLLFQQALTKHII
jgi:hypothetical protein